MNWQWMPKEVRGIPVEAKEKLRQALETDDPREFEGLCGDARSIVYMVGRCPDCCSPLGARHYCGRRSGVVYIEDVMRAHPGVSVDA